MIKARRWIPGLLLFLTHYASAQAIKTVTIATTATVVNGQPHFTGAHQRVIDEGWLAARLRERGINLVWIPVQGDTGATINEAFAAQRIDFGGYGDLPSVILNASGTRTQMIVPIGRGTNTFLLIPPNSTARSLKDLKGKSQHAVEQEFDDNGLAWKDFFTPIPDVAVYEHYRRTVSYAVDRHVVRTPLRAEDLIQTRFVLAALRDLQLEHYWAQVPVAAPTVALALDGHP
jgi:hypothetical protein